MRRSHIADMTVMGLSLALLALSGWIQIPAVVPFSLQTFAVFVLLFVWGGRKGSLAVALYLGMGLVGLPVFSGFRGGFGAFASPTGGFLVGFLAMSLTYWLLDHLLPAKKWKNLVAGAIAQWVCYACGLVWYACFFLSGKAGMGTVLLTCVVPFLLPDAAKLLAADLVSWRIPFSKM